MDKEEVDEVTSGQVDTDHEDSNESCSDDDEPDAQYEDGDAESGPDTGDESGSASESAEEMGFSSDTSNGESEKCPICLQRFTYQEIGVPDNCEHHFCLHCIAQWAKKVTTCPIDRKSFNSIMVKSELNGEIKYIEDVTSRDVSSVDWDEQELDPTFCEVCGHSDREDRLLLCDGCDLGFHLECLEPALDVVPIEDWYCPQCQNQRNTQVEPQPSTSVASNPRESRPRVPRTSLSRRIMQQRRLISSNCQTNLKPMGNTKSSHSTGRRAGTKPRKARRKYKTKVGKRISTKQKRRRKKRRVKRGTATSARNPNRCRVAQHMKPTTTKGRLAQNLGLILPRSGQPLIGLPSYRQTSVSSPNGSCSRAPSRRKRYQDGIVPSLSLFGSQFDLSECLETVSDDEAGSVGVARVQPIQRIGFPRKLGARLRDIDPLHLSSSSNVLGPILNSQSMLHIRDVRRIPASISSTPCDKVFCIPPLSMSKEADNDSSGYDSSRGNGEFPLRRSPPNVSNNIPFLTATGGNSSSSIRPSTSNASESRNANNTPSAYQGSSGGNFSNAGGSTGGHADSHSVQYTGNFLPGQRGPDDTEGLGFRICNTLNQPPKESEKVPEKSKLTDDDDDYNIYSDIEEEPRDDTAAVSLTEELFNTRESVPSSEVDAQDAVKDRDSDSDMVIDEQVPGVIGSQERESRSSVESLSPARTNLVLPKPVEPEPVSWSTPGQVSPSKPDQSNLLVDSEESDSQESIPLPDSTPPPSSRIFPEEQEEDILFLPETSSIARKSLKKDEYDPSQPLTSSDDDEDVVVIPSPKLTKNVVAKPSPKLLINLSKSPPAKSTTRSTKPSANVQISSDEDNDEEVDLSTIPMPSDEYRRPTIQFSIPSRHRLIPISSLIKRQKGVMRKETTGATQSFQSEISKAFGSEKGEEEEEEDTEAGAGKVEGESNVDHQSPEKVSLVAEIFGSDNEEEQDPSGVKKALAVDANLLNLQIKLPPPLSTVLPLQKEQLLIQSASLDVRLPVNLEEKDISGDSRWMKIVEDGIKRVDTPASSTTEPVNRSSEAPILSNENEEVIGLNGDKRDEKATTEGARDGLVADSKVSGSFLESISDEEAEFDSSSPKKALEKRKAKVTTDVSISPRKEVIAPTITRKGKKDKEPEKDLDRKQQKRRRSHSSDRSNFEEGEIAESPDKKKRKARKPKKSKHRRSRESDSPSSKDNASDKLGPELGPHSSSSEADGRSGIPWKKPSKSTKERNYRDGKPKTEEKFFREKDKKRERSAHTDRHKKERVEGREVSPTTLKMKSKEGEKVNPLDGKRGRRRSASKSRSKSPLPWRSLSRSVSKSRTTRERRKSNSSTSNRSGGSRSPSGHAHSRFGSSKSPRSRRWKHRRRHSVSQRRGFRSRSRSRTPPRIRSRSPAKRSRIRRRSRSLDSRERNQKVRRRSLSSSSGSEERSNSTRRKGSLEDKVAKKGKKDKEKEKVVKEKNVTQDQPQSKDKEKDKDKKRKKRKREKSASPAKEIFTDGDSIVVSLNFQKGKDASSTASNTNAVKDATAVTSKNDSDQTDQRKRRGKHTRKSSADRDGLPKPLKKTILIDLESSPIQEQNIGVSPTLIVLSDDEETLLESSKSSPSKSGRGKDVGNDRDGVTVSTTSAGSLLDGNSVSPSYRHVGHGVAADSTQLQPHQSESQSRSANALNFSKSPLSDDEMSSLSPTRGDSLVTSTRDSVEIPLPHDEDTHSPSSPQPPQLRANSPLTPPLPAGTPPPESLTAMDNSSHKDGRLLTPPTHSPITMGQNLPLNLPPPPGMNMGMGGRPLGIGNIPGLFPSSSMSMATTNLSGISMPAPIVIPTPPPPQIRFNPAVLNANVIASVANALYAPLLAAKHLQQQQQTLSRFPPIQMSNNSVIGSTNRSGDRHGQGSVLLPKNQNSHSSNNRRTAGEGGDPPSPFSPNSSEGDDLFEPPTDKAQSPRDDRQTTTGGYGGTNSDKNDRSGATGNSSGGTGGGKGKNSKLFDTLFGGPPVVKKPNQPQPGLHPNKPSHPDKSFRPKPPHHKFKTNKKAQKKEIVKISEGELRLSEDVPTSAVELRVKEKFLKKLNRQERVVEEVKLSLKPHYSKKHVDKDEYKEILRRAVPKICHNKSGEINPFKIKELIEAYVKKFRKNRKN